jgi:hypothetical protein
MHYKYRLRITDQLFKSYPFTGLVRSQSTLKRLLRRQIKKKNTFIFIVQSVEPYKRWGSNDLEICYLSSDPWGQ